MISLSNSNQYVGYKNCVSVYKEVHQVSIIDDDNARGEPKQFTYDSVYDIDSK